MKLMTGFLAGAIVGGYVVCTMTPDQRSKLASAANSAVDKVRGSSVASSVSSSAADVAEAAGERVAGVVDDAGSAIADKVAPDSSTPSSTTHVEFAPDGATTA